MKKKKMLRVLLDEKKYREYRIICAKLDLSMSAQLRKMIVTFVDVQEKNLDILEKL